jgi:hypothetical protein
VFRAIERGLTATGLTLHDVADEFDAGAIRVQMRSEIDPRGTHYSNLRRLMQAGADLAAGHRRGRMRPWTGPAGTVSTHHRAAGRLMATVAGMMDSPSSMS